MKLAHSPRCNTVIHGGECNCNNDPQAALPKPRVLPLINPDRIVIDAKEVGVTLRQEPERPNPRLPKGMKAFD